MLQLVDFEVLPVHWLPPYCGVGFVHDLVLTLVPPPHVTEQDPHLDQLVKPPWTEKKLVVYKIVRFHVNVIELLSIYKQD